jgi:hypothetical protein
MRIFIRIQLSVNSFDIVLGCVLSCSFLIHYKTQMGTTFSSCSHFVACELLHLWRQATVIVVGCISIFFVLAHSVDFISTHRFQILLFIAEPSGCPFGFPCGRPFRTEVLQNTVWFISRDQKLCYMEHFGLFSFPVPRNR